MIFFATNYLVSMKEDDQSGYVADDTGYVD
jgi:hypothetical protein